MWHQGHKSVVISLSQSSYLEHERKTWCFPQNWCLPRLKTQVEESQEKLHQRSCTFFQKPVMDTLRAQPPQPHSNSWVVAIVGSAAVVISEKPGCGYSGEEAAAAEVEVAVSWRWWSRGCTYRGRRECQRCCKTGCLNHVTTGSSFLRSQWWSSFPSNLLESLLFLIEDTLDIAAFTTTNTGLWANSSYRHYDIPAEDNVIRCTSSHHVNVHNLCGSNSIPVHTVKAVPRKFTDLWGPLYKDFFFLVTPIIFVGCCVSCLCSWCSHLLFMLMLSSLTLPNLNWLLILCPLSTTLQIIFLGSPKTQLAIPPHRIIPTLQVRLFVFVA